MNITIVKNSNDIIDFEEYTKLGFSEYAVDLEGDRLCRHGKINFIQICVVSTSKIFIFNCSELSSGEIRRALHPIFSDNSISKFMFDCRSDVDALYHQLDLKLDGVVDVQLFEIAYRKCNGFYNQRFYSGLFKTLNEQSFEAGVSSMDLKIKKKYSDQFKQDNYALNLNDHEVLRYMAIDVIYLKALHTVFNIKIGFGKMRSKINFETKKRQNCWMKPVFVNDRSNALSAI